MDKRILITIDTEALPARASSDHVKKLIWGKFDNGRAGIAEICDVIEEFGGKGLFFLEVAGSVHELAAYREINAYLERRGHMVEWHYHPEILGIDFWKDLGWEGSSLRQDLYSKKNCDIALEFGLKQFKLITGRKPRAYRAGAFRWNENTIGFMNNFDVRFSFNACRETSLLANFNTYAPNSSKPFLWKDTGVIEVPCGEVDFEGDIIHFRLPRRLPSNLTFSELLEKVASETDGLVNILLHSWSLLSRNKSDGHFFYSDLTRAQNLRNILRKATANHKFSIISSYEELEEVFNELC